jgi:hypothetical protein
MIWFRWLGSAAIGIVALGAVFLSYTLTYMEGQRSVRMATVVRLGVPYYRGAFMGQCYDEMKDGNQVRQFCATEDE